MIDIAIVGLAPRLFVGRKILLFVRAVVISRRWRGGRPAPGVLSGRGMIAPTEQKTRARSRLACTPQEEEPFGRGRGPRANAVFT